MNKKLLFGIMSLAALTACTNDEFESQKAAENVSPIQFEVVNGQDDAFTRASMNGNKIVWNANDGDLFTLYHGGAGITGYENAIYTAKANEGATATLTTPSMIKQGSAVMVWPVDTAFRIGPTDNISIEIPADQKADIENYLPYMSDQVTIGAYDNKAPYNTAGLERAYPVYMRPMASQLIVKADYVGSDAKIATLYSGDDPIDPIKVTSVELLTQAGGADKFTTNLNIKWTAPTPAINTQWGTVAHNAWTAVTDFDLTAINTQTAKLTTECLTGNESAKFLLLPQAAVAGGVDDGAVVVNTLYGKVLVGDPTVYAAAPNKSYYPAAEFNRAWYRIVSEAKAATAEENASTPGTGEFAGKHKVVALNPTLGMQQTINGLSNYVATSGVVKGEPVGAATTRYVEVNLKYLDMSGLHIKTDKQLRDAAKVWQKMGLEDVTVYLDGDATGKFEISQTTIAKINEINTGAKKFTVKPCDTHLCNKIVITGGGNVPDLAFIKVGDATNKADVVLEAGKNWSWTTNTVAGKKAIKVDATATGVANIINKGTFASSASATIAIYDNAGAPAQVTTIPFVNDGTWNITTGTTLNVQFDVTNNGEVNIASGAQYRQDGAGNDFTNEATTLPERFLAAGTAEKIGKVNNEGVFANINTGHINNYGLIEHLTADAKTFITTNQSGAADFTANFADPGNKMGRINLKWDNRAEDNVTVNNAAATGFVSVTVDGEVSTLGTAAGALGAYVNYIIIKSGVTEINALNAQYKYVEIADKNNTEIAWKTGSASNYTGLIVLSPVNITYGTTVNATVTYLGADMYVGGTFNKAGTDWDGYYGDTSGAVATKYITFN